MRGGTSFSHNIKEQNFVLTKFDYKAGDVVRVETNGDKLLFLNERNKKEHRLELKMSEDEWKQAFFCVELDC